MQSAATFLVGCTIILAVALVGYWFWVPDVGALRTWDEFRSLPTLECSIGDARVSGLTGTMYIRNGNLRADYVIQDAEVTTTFHTIIEKDGTTFTWADDVPFAEQSKLHLGEGSAAEELFKISHCKRVWNIRDEQFIVPPSLVFTDRS